MVQIRSPALAARPGQRFCTVTLNFITFDNGWGNHENNCEEEFFVSG